MKYLHKLSAVWCSPCRALGVTLSQLDLEAAGINLIKQDVDLLPKEVVQKLGVKSIPTLILMDESGNELGRKTGALTADEIRQWLEV